MATLTGPFDPSMKPGDEIRIANAAVKNYRGGAASIIAGTGYATPLVVATALTRFIGVYEEGADNTNGTPGTFTYGAPGSGLAPFVHVARTGTAEFNQTGFTQANVDGWAFFSDDNNISTTPNTRPAGLVVTVNESTSKAVVDIYPAVIRKPFPPITLSGSTDAISPHDSATYVVTTAGVDAMTLAAPTSGTDDGVTITVISRTANAHTITATGLIADGSTTTDVATFAAHPGASVKLYAHGGKWNVIASTAITFS